MKNITNTLMVLVVAFFVFSCGSKEIQDAKNAYEVVSKSQDIAKNMQENMDKASKRREERKAKGDTLAINYKELQKFLPSKPNGYELDGEMKGESTSMNGMAFSQAECTFKKGDQSIRFVLADYNGAYELYAGLSAVWSSGLNLENDSEKIGPFNIGEDAKGMQTIKKKEKGVSVVMGIGERFYLVVEARGTDDVDFVTSVIKTMDIAGMAKK